ncbi:hypothetical protein ACFOZY_07150 [Chungangia koreensis]|uniref:Acetylglutamate kinase n=1 Tax=Chungangia koreensis TaxID=752657 RepID=A0ABV8X2P6_9LACT
MNGFYGFNYYVPFPYSMRLYPYQAAVQGLNPIGRANDQYIHRKSADLKAAMRTLWEQHITWTRMTITSLVFKLPDANLVVDRLLQNPVDQGKTLARFYGKKIGDRYAVLLNEHLTIAAELVKAAMAGDNQKADELDKEWHRNGDDIARFLSRINPFINEQAMREMFYEHLALTKLEAVCMITKKYSEEIKVYDRIEEQALMMSDELSNAITRQFMLF